jgi:hypothetical protein
MMKTSVIAGVLVIALSEHLVAQCGFVLWTKTVVSVRKGEITREPAEWSPLDGYEDIRECRADGAKRIKDRSWIYEGLGFTANATNERSVTFENKKEQTGILIESLCFPATFDPRK